MAGPNDAFDRLEATLLLCPRCGVARPVRKRLLLVLPTGDKVEYLCAECGSTCGETVEPPTDPFPLTGSGRR
ncbi:MAG: hypothetical protein KatS3mg076_1357 [Candidatus Binatia bacterium]|nr:MAG: hypothetical protein KatS3mg076_1357 [Candidatus Binatia bacterium]